MHLSGLGAREVPVKRIHPVNVYTLTCNYCNYLSLLLKKLFLFLFFLHLLPREPPSFLNLFLIHFDVCRYGDSMAANHEAGGHRPRLAGHILNRPNLHAALLLHLPPHCILHCLSCRDTQGGQVGVTFCIFFIWSLCVFVCVCVCYQAQ